MFHVDEHVEIGPFRTKISKIPATNYFHHRPSDFWTLQPPNPPIFVSWARWARFAKATKLAL